MKWKPSAALWGAGLFATLYASLPPARTPTGAPPASRPSQRDEAAAAAIAHEAARLQGQLRPQSSFIAPGRDPFRFSRGRLTQQTATSAPEPIAASAQPAAPSISLLGIAADETATGVEFTAILSTSAGVVLVREGDAVGRYVVRQIEEGGVALLDTDTQASLRLTFTP